LLSKHPREQIEAACEHALCSSQPSYQAVKRYLERLQAAKSTPTLTTMRLRQRGIVLHAVDLSSRDAKVSA
jgi:hypothetical protein